MASQSEGFANFEKFELHGKAITKLKVDELKAELQARGLTKTGLKKELLERLCKALEKESASTEHTTSLEEKPTVNNDEISSKEVSSTTATQDASNQDELQTTEEDKKESVENTEETKDEKKSNETDTPDDKNNDTVKTEEVEDGEIIGQEDEKKENQKPAVPEKRRRISLTRQTSNPPAPGTRREKRKWSSNKPKTSVVISTDSLKGLIPGVQLASTAALEAVMELDDDKEDEEVIEVKKQGEEKEQEPTSNHKLDERSSNKKRIVEIADSKTVRLGEAIKDSDTDKNDVTVDEPVHLDEVTQADAGNHDDNQSSAATPPSSETATPVKREVSPPRNAPSCALHVSNLVRPFTQKQLMQYLSQFGALTEKGFWMNKIKSHCYVAFASIDEATNARQSTHGQRWPATSPKLLKVDFADDEKMSEDTDGALGKKIEITEPKIENVQDEKDDKEKSREKSKEKSTRKHKDKREEKKKDESGPSAANLLDKLFRKTTAVPCIYWLPLTVEQIATKEKEREERRQQRQLAIQKEEKQGEQKPPPDVKKPPELNSRDQKPREMPRDQERKPLRDNRASSPPSRKRPERRPSPVKRRSRSRSPAFRRAVNRRR